MKRKYNHVDKELRFWGWLYTYCLRAGIKKDGMAGFSRAETEKEKSIPEDKTVMVRKEVISCPGNDKLEVYIYSSKNVSANATGLLWIHGGGYAMGSAAGELEGIRAFVETTNTVVISPEYTLSGIAPYPQAFHEVYATLKWMKEQHGQLGINPNQIFVGGGSAGGGMTAAVVLKARDEGEVHIAFQMPISPMLNDHMDTDSMRGNKEFLWNEELNREGWKLYLGERYQTENVPKYAAPYRETDYHDLPPAYTYVGDLDPFYDETITYMERMRSAGVDVKYDIYLGAYHGFDIVSKAKVTKKAKKKLLDEYQYAVLHYFAENH